MLATRITQPLLTRNIHHQDIISIMGSKGTNPNIRGTIILGSRDINSSTGNPNIRASPSVSITSPILPRFQVDEPPQVCGKRDVGSNLLTTSVPLCSRSLVWE